MQVEVKYDPEQGWFVRWVGGPAMHVLDARLADVELYVAAHGFIAEHGRRARDFSDWKGVP